MSFIRRYLPAILAGAVDYTVIEFQVDADAGDVVSISTSVSSGLNPVVSLVWGTGEVHLTSSSSYTFPSDGTYTVQVVAQPDFAGVTDLKAGGRNQANIIEEIQNIGLQKLSDLATLNLQRNDIVGTVDDDTFPGGITKIILLENKNMDGDLTSDVLNAGCEEFYLKAWGINNSPNPKVELGDFQEMREFRGRFGPAKDRGSFSTLSPNLEYANSIRNITGTPADAPQGTKDNLRVWDRGTGNQYPITDWFGYTSLEVLNIRDDANGVVSDLDTSQSGIPNLKQVEAGLSGPLEDLPPGIEISRIGTTNPSDNAFDVNNHPDLQSIIEWPNGLSCLEFERFVGNLHSNRAELPGGSGGGSLSLEFINANKATVSDQAFNQIQEIESDTDCSFSLASIARVSTC